jgi:hypothetical protein
VNLPNDPASIIRQALADAVLYRTLYSDGASRGLAGEYRKTQLLMDAGLIHVLAAVTMTHVNPDGTITLSLDDVTVFGRSLADASRYRLRERCKRAPQNAALAAAYAALADMIRGTYA